MNFMKESKRKCLVMSEKQRFFPKKHYYKCPKCKSPLDYHHEEELTVTFECKRCKCLVLTRKPFVGLTVQRKPLTHIPEQTGTLRKSSIDHKKKY